jgi:NADPH:quinone reductase-like Zn-dependent oxidoreductase
MRIMGLRRCRAKCRGAGKVIATGRNEVELQELRALGADEVIAVQSW